MFRICVLEYGNHEPDVTNWLTGEDPDYGKDWGQEEKGMTEDEMVRWPHQLNGHELGWTPGVDDGLGGLVCCSSWGRKESDMTVQLNWIELIAIWSKILMHEKTDGIAHIKLA